MTETSIEARPPGEARSRAPFRRLPFRPDLEGMRAVAVILVVAYHAGIPFIPGGYIGVDVFFVLSGLLITNHLLWELSSTGRIRLAAFYSRRVRRLLPAAVTVIMVTVLVVSAFAPPSLVGPVLDDARAALVFVPNLLFADRATDYLAETSPSPLLHYWSLGVEEQFYLIWPVLLLLLWWASRRSPRVLVVSVVLLVAVSFLASIVVTSASEPWGYFAPWTRAWELGLGALIAVLRLHDLRWHPALAAAVAWVGLAFIVGSAMVFTESTVFPGSVAAIPVLGAVAVAAATPSSARWGPSALLAARPMQFVGRISYSLYLVHWPLLVVPVIASAMGEPLPLAHSLLLAGLSVPLAWALHRLVERPIMRSRRIAAGGARLLLPAGALAIAVGLVGVQSAAAVVADKPLSTAVVVRAPATVDAWPDFSAVVPADLQPALDDAAADLPTIYSDGCHLGVDVSQPADCVFGEPGSEETVVLFGDSHAAQWFPALEAIATSRSTRLESHTKSNCPPFPVEIITNGVVDSGCAVWRESVIESLEREAPATIVMSAFAHYDEYGSPAATEDAWRSAVEVVVRRLSVGSRVFVIDDTPRFPRTPALCLSANIANTAACDLPRDRAFDDGFARAQRRAVVAGGGTPVSLNERLCDERRCGTVMGNLLVYRDQHHIATRISALLAGELERAIYPVR